MKAWFLNLLIVFGSLVSAFGQVDSTTQNPAEETIVLNNQRDSTASKKEDKQPFLYFLKEKDPRYNPQKALFYGLVFPSGGQVFNKDYWKAPLALGAVGTAVYFVIDFRQEYLKYRNAYRFRVDDDPTTIDEFADNPNATDQAILELRTTYHKWFEQAILASVAVYTLTAIEAYTSAHLKDFDISDDLSLRLHPSIQWQTHSSDAQGLNVGVGVKVFIKPASSAVALDFH